MFSSWFKGFFKSRKRAANVNSRTTRPSSRFRPTLEVLEDRRLPTLAFNLVGTQVLLAINTNGSIMDVADTQSALYRGVDIFFRGDPVEHYVIARNGDSPNSPTGGTNSVVFREDSTPPNPVSVVNTSHGNILSARITTTVFGTSSSGLQLERTISFLKTSSVVSVVIRLVNNSDATISQVGFLESGDPDPPKTSSRGSETQNTVTSNGHVVRGNLNIPKSEKPGPIAVAFGSADPRVAVSIEPPIEWYDVFSVINDPQHAPTLADNSINLALNFGDIPAGSFRAGGFGILFAPSGPLADQKFHNQLPYGNVGLVALSSAIQTSTRPIRYTYDPARNVYTGYLTVYNKSSVNIIQDITFVLKNLPAGVRLVNADGTDPQGNPYVRLAANTLLSHSSVRIPIVLRSTSNSFISSSFLKFPLEVLAGPFDPSIV